MSRVGKTPIPLSKGVNAKLVDSVLYVEGPKGKLCQRIPNGVNIQISGENIEVTRASDQRQMRSLHGLTRTLIANMIVGVTQGFSKQLEIVGVGYRAEMKGNALNFSLGYSHPINFVLTEGIKAKVEKQVITVEGIDKGLVGQTAAKIRSLKKPDAYKGKGVRYVGEVVRTKAGKTGVK
jgi:large subunit ribosomal protein L6